MNSPNPAWKDSIFYNKFIENTKFRQYLKFFKYFI